MSAIAYVNEKGQIETTASQDSIASKAIGSGGKVDKDTFLQLLVAQMKYQDPLEPTSNTEYISQYATFTQVEEMQNMSSSVELQRASNLVGKEVIISAQGKDGKTTTVQGKVDYVSYENNKAYVSVGENLYSASDVTTIVDKTYMDAYELATDLVTRIAQLPNVNSVLSSNLKEIDELESIYNNMNDYEKTFVASDAVKALKEYVTKAKEVRLAEEAKAGKGAE